MLQASVFDCFAFDPFSFEQNGLAAPEVDIGGREVFQALVVSLVIVVADELIDLRFMIAGQIIVFQQNTVLECLMPTLDLALGLRMIGSAANVLHISVIEPFSQIADDITAIIHDGYRI